MGTAVLRPLWMRPILPAWQIDKLSTLIYATRLQNKAKVVANKEKLMPPRGLQHFSRSRMSRRRAKKLAAGGLKVAEVNEAQWNPAIRNEETVAGEMETE